MVLDGRGLDVVHETLQVAVWPYRTEVTPYESCSALDQARVRLVANVVRSMAAALGLVVRYPDGTEIDWSRAVDMGRAPMAVAI